MVTDVQHLNKNPDPKPCAADHESAKPQNCRCGFEELVTTFRYSPPLYYVGSCMLQDGNKCRINLTYLQHAPYILRRNSDSTQELEPWLQRVWVRGLAFFQRWGNYDLGFLGRGSRFGTFDFECRSVGLMEAQLLAMGLQGNGVSPWTQYPFITEYSLNHIRHPSIV